ncbi:hypothetical protein AAMO2058_000585500 [Amorphochlora amoebiformis]
MAGKERVLVVFDNLSRPGCGTCTLEAPCGTIYAPFCAQSSLIHCLFTCCLSDRPCCICLPSCSKSSISTDNCCPNPSTKLCYSLCGEKATKRLMKCKCAWYTPCIACAPSDGFPVEKLAQNLLAKEVIRQLGTEFEYVSYTLEEDLRHGVPIPEDIKIALFFIHDWPTIHEDPNWMANFMDMFHMIPITIPSQEEIRGIFRKTEYMAQAIPILQKTAGVLPTRVITETTDLKEVSKWACGLDVKKIVTKENYSAGKEGVEEIKAESVEDVYLCLDRARHNLIQTAKQYPFFDPNFIVQQYEPRFKSEPETRLFYSKATFLYAIQHTGWLDSEHWPVAVDPEACCQEREKAALLFKSMKTLRNYVLIRIDFGPDARLNEIELLPDLFGGPKLNLSGKELRSVLTTVATNLTKSLRSNLHHHNPLPPRRPASAVSSVCIYHENKNQRRKRGPRVIHEQPGSCGINRRSSLANRFLDSGTILASGGDRSGGDKKVESSVNV